MKYKEKDYTLEKFSERIQDLGFEMNKINTKKESRSIK
jgi:hypothetical protein